MEGKTTRGYISIAVNIEDGQDTTETRGIGNFVLAAGSRYST